MNDYLLLKLVFNPVSLELNIPIEPWNNNNNHNLWKKMGKVPTDDESQKMILWYFARFGTIRTI